MADAASTVSELVRVATERIAASGSGSARLDAELLLGQTLGMDRTGHPRPPGRARRRRRAAGVRGRRRAPRARRAGRLHPRLPRVPRARLRDRLARADPATRDGAARRRRAGRGHHAPRGHPAAPRGAGAAGRGRRHGNRGDRDLPARGPAPPEDGRPGAGHRGRRLGGGPPAGARERRRARRGRPDGVRRRRPPAVPRRAAVRRGVREPPVRPDRRAAAPVARDRVRADAPRSTAGRTASTSCAA